jgi:hypothetical protein
MSRSRKKRRLSQQDLRSLGATRGLMSRRIGPDGRTKLEQLTAEASRRPSPFSRKVPLLKRRDR